MAFHGETPSLPPKALLPDLNGALARAQLHHARGETPGRLAVHQNFGVGRDRGHGKPVLGVKVEKDLAQLPGPHGDFFFPGPEGLVDGAHAIGAHGQGLGIDLVGLSGFSFVLDVDVAEGPDDDAQGAGADGLGRTCNGGYGFLRGQPAPSLTFLMSPEPIFLTRSSP